MSKYSIEIKPAARKELEALSDRLLGRVVSKIESLSHTPRPSGCKKLKGYKDQWRIRIGDFRVVYFIDDDKLPVEVTRIRHRREAYER